MNEDHDEITDQGNNPTKKKTRGKTIMTEENKAKAIALKTKKGLTYHELSKLFNVSRQSIHKAISHLIPDKQSVTLFNNHKSDILDHLQMMYAYTLINNPHIILENCIKRGTTDLAILCDKAALEKHGVQPSIQINVITERATMLLNQLKDTAPMIGDEKICTQMIGLPTVDIES